MADVTKQTKLLRFYSEFYRPLKLRGGSLKTDGLYFMAITHLSRFVGHDATVGDLTDDTLARYAFHRRSLQKAAATVNGETAKLRALWNYCCKRGILKLWPTFEDEPEPKRVPLAWLRPEMEALCRAAMRSKGYVGDAPYNEYFPALILTIWDTFERIGALRALEWQHLDERTGWLRIPSEVRKGRVKERMCQLNPLDTLPAVLRLRRYNRKFIFAWDKNPRYLYRVWKSILEDAGLPTDRRSMFHRIRRSCASHGKAAGLNVQELLGHDSPRTTEGYLDPRIILTEHPHSVLFRPGTSPEGF